MCTDLHQHVWTEPLLDALAARQRAPLVRRADGLTVLHCPGELPCVIDEAAEEVELMNNSGALLESARAFA